MGAKGSVEARTRASGRYHAKACVAYTMRLMRVRDKDLIEWFGRVPNKADFLRQAIRRAMEEEKR